MQLVSTDRIVILSPHLDDAAFSCGGLIIAAKNAGASICVISFFTEGPAGEPSHFARLISGIDGDECRRWMRSRQLEDKAALAEYAEIIHFPFKDAVFRRDDKGGEYYNSWSHIFGVVNKRDESEFSQYADWVREIILERAPTHLFLPLGIGGHVDHMLIRNMGAKMELGVSVQKIWYEELPYASTVSISSHEKTLILEFDLAQKRRLVSKYINGLGTSGNQAEMLAQILKYNHENYRVSERVTVSP